MLHRHTPMPNMCLIVKLLCHVIPCDTHGVTNVTPCVSHGLTIVNPCVSHGLTIVTPCVSHGVTNVTPCVSHGVTIVTPCVSHEVTFAILLHFRRCTLVQHRIFDVGYACGAVSEWSGIASHRVF